MVESIKQSLFDRTFDGEVCSYDDMHQVVSEVFPRAIGVASKPGGHALKAEDEYDQTNEEELRRLKILQR